jgi:hypothetical protein
MSSKVKRLEERVNRMAFGSKEKRAYNEGEVAAIKEFSQFFRSLPKTVQSAIGECLTLYGEGGDMNKWYAQLMKKAQESEAFSQSHLGEGSTIRKCNACGQVYCSELLMADHCVRNHTSPTPKQ